MLGARAVDLLRDRGRDVGFEQLDVADPAGVRDCADRLHRAGRTVDVLVNNAGVLLPADSSVLDTAEDVLLANLQVHFLGAYRTCQAFVPGMVERGHGRVVNVVSGWGSIADGVPGPAGYALAKAALRALTRRVAAETRGAGDVKVNAIDPGWVATRMGGGSANTSARQAAAAVARLALLGAEGATDTCFTWRGPVPW